MEAESSEDVVSSANEELKTPVRQPRASKRKAISPLTPQGRTSPGVPDGDLSVPLAKRRRKSASNLPQSPLLKPPLTERQQMALLMQMTDPKQATMSGGEESVSTTPKSESSLTPRSRLQKRNERGETLLHTACIRGDLKLVASLIDQGADINTTDNAGWTPLHEACNHGHVKVVSVLLKHRADVNARGMDGDTPLHDAAVNGHTETVQLLLKYGANPRQTNDKELNAIDSCKNSEIVTLMEEWPNRGTQEDSEEEDVFATSRDTRPLSRSSQLRIGSKGSSRSSAGDDSDGSLVKGRSDQTPRRRGRPKKQATNNTSHRAGYTPKSRPHGVIYSDLSSSGSEGESGALEKTPRGRKSGKYNLAKMAETKQKLLGKLDESSEVDERRKKLVDHRVWSADGGQDGLDDDHKLDEEEEEEAMEQVEQNNGDGSEKEEDYVEEKEEDVEEKEEDVEEKEDDVEEKEDDVEEKEDDVEEKEDDVEEEDVEEEDVEEEDEEEDDVEEDDVEKKEDEDELEEGQVVEEDVERNGDITEEEGNKVLKEEEDRNGEDEEKENDEDDVDQCEEEEEGDEDMEDDGEEEEKSEDGDQEDNGKEFSAEEVKEDSEDEENVSGMDQSMDDEEEEEELEEERSLQKPAEEKKEDVKLEELPDNEEEPAGEVCHEGAASDVCPSSPGQESPSTSEVEETTLLQGSSSLLSQPLPSDAASPVSPVPQDEPSTGAATPMDAEDQAAEVLNESNETESASMESSHADEEQDKDLELNHCSEEKQKPSSTEVTPDADTSEKRIKKDIYISSSESEQDSAPMEAGPPDNLSTSNSSSAFNDTPDRDSAALLSSTPPTSSAPQGMVKRVKERESKKSTPVASSPEDSEVVFDRVLRSAARKSQNSGTAGEKESANGGRSFLVSWSLKMLKRPLGGAEDSRMSCSLPRLDIESSRPYNNHSRYTHGAERHDSTSSGGGHDSPHSGRDMDHVMVKHRAMAHQQTPLGRRMAEEREGRGRRDSFSVSFDWPSLPAGSHASTQSAPCSTVASPLSGHRDDEDHDDGERKAGSKRDGSSHPLVGSGANESSEGPLGFPLHSGVGGEEHEELLGGAEMSLTSTPVPSHHHHHHRAKGQLLSASDGFKFGGPGGKATPTKRERGNSGSQDKPDLSHLPPKKRYRPVVKSSVVQQRQKTNSHCVPSPDHISSFLMFTRDYFSNKKPQPTDPKLVYPPVVPAMYKLFTEQEAERIQLIMSHLSQQDRIVLSMEQELLRAHQRATRDYIPLSVCSVLLENLQNHQGLTCRSLLAGGYGHCDSFTSHDNSARMTSPPHEGDGPVDLRVLTGLVQDVWDKFQDLHGSMQIRHKNEAQALWAMQHLQWTQKIKELGVSTIFSNDFPSSHVPLATPTH